DVVAAPVPEPNPVAPAENVSAITQGSEPVDAEPTQPPLLRTPHALYPIALEATDSAIPNAASATSDGDLPVLTGARSGEFPTGPIALGGAGLAGVVGLAVGAQRLRRLRRLSHEPESEVVVEGGFAAAELTPDGGRDGGQRDDTLGVIVAGLQVLIEE